MPDWELRLWTDEDNNDLVRTEFPHMVQWFDALPFGIMRADVARYMYMYVTGGLYLDLDYELIRPFDRTTETCVLPLEHDGPVPGGGRLGNAVLASEPRGAFFEFV